jgi:hypothetical protein
MKKITVDGYLKERDSDRVYHQLTTTSDIPITKTGSVLRIHHDHGEMYIDESCFSYLSIYCYE